MNSPFVVEQAAALAERVYDAASTDQERVELAYKLCFARLPSPEEAQRLLDFLGASQSSAEVKKKDAQLANWTTACHALLASAEFRYID